VLYVPFLQKLFYFDRLDALDVVICLTAGIVSIAWFEVLKATNGRRKRPIAA